MSGLMDSFDSLNDTPVTNDNSLPPDLESLYHRVLRDSEQWRAGLPGTDALARQVAALAGRKPESRSPSYGIREEIDMPDSPQIEPSLRDRPALQLRPRFRAGGFLAAGSVVILVALFAVLFAVLPHGPQNTPGAGPATPVGTATATAPGARHGKWQPVPGLTHTPGLPVIAPSNPNVVYEVVGNTVRRSGDRGATWSNLPNPSDFPSGYTPQWLDLFVSPLKPDTLWTTANLTGPGGIANCPMPPPFAYTGGNAALGGSVPCQVQNVSTDGGHTWKLVKLSFGYMLGTNSPDANNTGAFDQFSQTPQAQGNRLYTLTTNGPLATSAHSGHIAASSDGGVTWHDASAPLAGAGMQVCNIAAAPNGSTIFAVAANPAANTGCGPEYNPTFSLWASTDAGAHWSQRTLPGGRLISSVAAIGGAHPTVYVFMPTAASGHAVTALDLWTSMFASTDGGRTWKQSPGRGLPANMLGGGPMTVFGDGSIVVPFVTSTQVGQNQLATYTFAQWEPGGAAWQPIAHLDLYGISQLQTLPDPTTGADALWLTVLDSGDPQSSSAFSVETFLP